MEEQTLIIFMHHIQPNSMRLKQNKLCKNSGDSHVKCLACSYFTRLRIMHFLKSKKFFWLKYVFSPCNYACFPNIPLQNVFFKYVPAKWCCFKYALSLVCHYKKTSLAITRQIFLHFIFINVNVFNLTLKSSSSPI